MSRTYLACSKVHRPSEAAKRASPLPLVNWRISLSSAQSLFPFESIRVIVTSIVIGSVRNFTTFRNSLPLFLSFSLSVHVCALGQSFPAKFLESRILLHPRDRRRIGALPRHSHEEIKVQFRHGSSLCSASESAQRPRFNLLSRAAPRNLGNRAFGWVGLKKRRLTNIASARASEFRIWHSRSDT